MNFPNVRWRFAPVTRSRSREDRWPALEFARERVTAEEARTKSQSSAREHPAPMAGPFKAQTMGCPTSSMSL
jgi:hypothetical protein